MPNLISEYNSSQIQIISSCFRPTIYKLLLNCGKPGREIPEILSVSDMKLIRGWIILRIEGSCYR